MHGRKRADPNEVEAPGEREKRLVKIEKYKKLSALILSKVQLDTVIVGLDFFNSQHFLI